MEAYIAEIKNSEKYVQRGMCDPKQVPVDS